MQENESDSVQITGLRLCRWGLNFISRLVSFSCICSCGYELVICMCLSRIVLTCIVECSRSYLVLLLLDFCQLV